MLPEKFEEFCLEVDAAKKLRLCKCIQSKYLTNEQLQTLRRKYFVVLVPPYSEKMFMIC